ncbi:MAG: Na(+)-translocating NADH-quinone reductase subunit C, partial [Muribaculaceae bacterium]|nr:Na(+)-translocating NADH-quinone reductase subunit C [Muribaculaceae bacterium]
MKINKESNVYTVVYAAVLVVVVGFALALVYQALRPAQLENIANDTKKQILAAALIYPTADESIGDLYDSHIKESYCVDSKGNKIDGAVALDINMAAEVKKPADERVLPVFVCSTDKGMKYIVPVAGAGLWGPIWGY